MDALFELYVQAGLLGSVVILPILLLRLILRKAPRQLICLLWMLAAVRLLIPWSIESSLSLQPHLQETAVWWAEHVPEDIKNILPVLWMAAAGGVALYGVVSYILLKYKVRLAVKWSKNILECDRIRGAFVMGYFPPKMYLSAAVEQKDRGHIIAHEQAHIDRGDHWWKLLGFLCLCLHWYNPLVWLAYTLFCRDTEVACDERVVWSMGVEDRKAYSLALLNCGRQISGLPAIVLCFGKISLGKRIENVLSYRKPGLWITAAAGMLVVFVALCFLTIPR